MPSENEASPAFVCQRCGDCCKGYGGTYVTDADIRAIAAYIGVPPDRFLREYCVISGGKPLLRQGENGYCVFWDRVCTIHPVKPRMCRAWPFLNSVLVDPVNWRIMADACPGIRTDLTDEAIVSTVRSALSDEAAMRRKKPTCGLP